MASTVVSDLDENQDAAWPFGLDWPLEETIELPQLSPGNPLGKTPLNISASLFKTTHIETLKFDDNDSRFYYNSISTSFKNYNLMKSKIS